jgi:transposase
VPIKQIARQLGISRNTVRAKLAADAPPKYERPAAGSSVDEFEPRIRALLKDWPMMPATVIAERIGWTKGMTVLTGRVRELRPVYLPPDPASRTTYVAGEVAQNDFWFPDIEVPVGFGQTRTAKQLPVLTMVSAYSRMLFARLVPTRRAEDLFCGWWQHLSRLGAVPRVLVWDGEGAVGAYGGGRNKLTVECQAFRGTLVDRITADRAAMPPLPPLPPATGWRISGRLPRDFYVRLDSNDYSVHPSVIGRRIEVIADLGRVRAFCDGRVVADHARIWAKHQSLTLPEHDLAAKQLRRDRIGLVRPTIEPDVEIRQLSDYDTALGLAGLDVPGVDDADGTVA